MPRAVVAYLRVSTRQQGASGLGIEAQQAAIEDYVRRNELRLAAAFTEIESGKKSARPTLERALSACRAHRATLLVAKLDRLSRNAAFLLSLRDAGVEVKACDMPDANRLVIGIMAMIAEWEAEQIATRTREGLAAAKMRGVKLGGRRGTNVSDEARRISAQRRTLRARERAFDIAQQIPGWAAMDPKTLCIALRTHAIPTASGHGLWTLDKARHLLRHLCIV